MKQKIFLMVIGFLLTTLTFAQPPQGGQFNPEEMVKKQTQEMVDSLGLNEKQAEQAGTINKKYSEKMRTLFQEGRDGDREAMREKMETMRTEKDAELAKVFTPEQFKKYKELEQKRMEERRARRSNAGESPERRGRPRGGEN